MLISSSTNRVGSAQTPWHDIFDEDNGHARYFGDAKTPGQDPAQTPGNRALLRLMRSILQLTRRSGHERQSFRKCLITHWFLSLADARGKIKTWRRDYNECRPHTSPPNLLHLQGLTPADEGRSLTLNLDAKPRNRQKRSDYNPNWWKAAGHVTLPSKSFHHSIIYFQ